MSVIKMLTGKLAGLFLFILLISNHSHAFYPTPDIEEILDVGPDGGVLEADDPETGVSVVLEIPEGALTRTTSITLRILRSHLPKVLDKTHIHGISVLPEGLLLLEEATLDVYNAPVDVTQRMFLYHVINKEFIIPLDSQEKREDENWIRGTFYITGNFSLGTPTSAEAASQCKMLAAYNPSRPLAYNDALNTDGIHLDDQQAHLDTYFGCGGPHGDAAATVGNQPVFSGQSDEACLRWQKALTKVGGTLSWVEYYIMTGNKTAENAERRNAERALQEAIDDFLSQPPPENKCGNYIKAAAKYYETSILIGMNEGTTSRLQHHVEQLVDQCAFVFSLETREWIDHPTEKHDDGSTTQEKMTWYGIIKCHIPWNEFLVTGRMKVRGEGNMSLHHENHWVGGEENTHEVTNTNWRVKEISGSVHMNYDEYGEAHPVADITIYWEGTAESHMWGKRHGNPAYDLKGSEDRSYTDYKSFPIENGYSEKFGDSNYGQSLTVYILNKPGYEKDNPNDCF